MKKYISIMMIIMIVLFAAGCEGGGADSQASSGSAGASGQETAAETSGEPAEETSESEAAEDAAGDGTDVDVDLSTLSTTMVYAQVYDMMTKPDEFMGKTIKASGAFAVYTDEASGKNYYACIIQDATACCQQGLEFEPKDKYSYPDDFPELGTEVTVIGTFDTYEENGATYCTLRKAKIL